METQKKMKMKKKAVLICKRRSCENASSENKLHFCENHFKLNKEFLANNPSLVTKEKGQFFGIHTPFPTKKEEKKKIQKEEEKELPPDEQRCCKSDGFSWRCKNVRMWVDDEDTSNIPSSKYCQHHYIQQQGLKYKKERNKRSGHGEGCSNKRRKKVVAEDEDDRSLDETGIQHLSNTCDSDPIIAEIWKNRNKVMADDFSVDETEIQPANSDTSDKIIEGGSANTGTKRKNIERTECSGELESLTITRDPVVELESLEHYKSQCVKLAVELEKKKVECTTLQGKLAESDTRMTAVTDECKRTLADATECWRKMLSDLESRVLRMEMEKSTMGCLESRISNLESIVQRLDNENSTVAGCVESRILKLESLNLRIEDENLTRAGCVESRLLNLETLVLGSRKPFVHVVSDDSGESCGQSLKEDCKHSVDSKKSFGDLMVKLAMNSWNRNMDKEIKWKSEADLLSSFEEDPKLCMKAVCALYRQEVSVDEISAKGLFHYRDVIRVTTLAKFLMDGDCKGDLKKSVEELEIFDSEAVKNCKMLARSYSKQLFSIYQNRKDPYFLPTTTDIHGDQSAT